jgi:periplasmic protein TonB
MGMVPPDRTSPSDSTFRRHHFLTDAPSAQGASCRDTVSGFTLSLLAHGLAAIVAGIAVVHPAWNKTTSSSSATRPTRSPSIVWTARAPGDLPGGGGDKKPRPAAAAQLTGRQSTALRVRQPVLPSPAEPRSVPELPRELVIPEPAIMAGLRDTVGAVTEIRPFELPSRGPGSGPGADGIRGTGAGPGDGPGIGSGDGEYPGNGVSWPRLVQEVKPNYTAAAMRAQVEGMVELEILVLPDGSVGRVNIVRSLDSRFGLDDEAIKAVRRWRFDPGRRAGKAVPVRVGVELSFNLR